ncbi:MAG: hypothetical protein Kow0099_33680 [Candidatus Abyssubacteria bacterium]
MLPLILALIGTLSPPDIAITLFEEKTSAGRIHWEEARREENLIGESPFDQAGNYYTIEPDGFDSPAHPTVIMKHSESGQTVFATLRHPQGYEARFEAITFDRAGNMLVAVLLWKKTPVGFQEWRAYYKIEGMPAFPYAKHFMLLIGTLLLIFIIVSGHSHLFRRLLRNRTM